MEFGLQLAGRPAKEILEGARKAETAGFSAVYVPDHFAYEKPTGGGLDDAAPAWEAIAILGAIAAVTTKVRLGGLVWCNLFRHPASTAQAVTTLDHVSGGRAILGLGSGWTRSEFEMTGIDFPEIKPRLRMLDEALRAIKQLWTEPRASFAGEFYTLKDAISVPKPVQKPHPPIMLGGSGKGLLRIAAREADIVNVIADAGRAGTILPSEIAKVTEEAFKKKLEFVKSEAAAAGRDPAKITLSTTIFIPILTDTPAATQAMAGGMGGAFGMSAEQVLRMPLALIGTPDECVAELQRREREWGVSHMIVSGFGTPGVAERLAGEVLPRV